MKTWKVLILIVIVVITISWFVVTPEKSFSVSSQRVDNSKSAAITEKWNGAVYFSDMIWR